MKKFTIVFAFATLATLVAFKPINNTTWTLDKAHAKLGFTVTHLMVSEVEGSFTSFDSKISCTKSDFSDAVVELSADVRSVNTYNEGRDKHLRSADFFDADKYPTITFKSKSFTKSSENTYKIAGDLTMHGVTKSVELNAIAKSGTNPMSNKSITGFKVTGVINRIDFNLSPSTPSSMLSNEISITANAEFTKD